MARRTQASGAQGPRGKPERVASNDSEPGEEAVAWADPWMRAAQVAIVGLFMIALLAAAHAAQPVLIPVLLAWVVATIARPAVGFLQSYRVPRAISAILITCALLTLIVTLLLVLSTPLTHWVGRTAELGLLIKQKLEQMQQPIAAIDELRKALSTVTSSEPGALKVEEPPAGVVAILAGLTPAVSQFILFVGALLFYLVYQERIQTTAVLLLQERTARLAALRTLNDINESMTTYFATFTVVNACLALLTILLTWLVGLPNPLLWGVLAGLLNYIPYVGPAIVIATLAIVGLIALPSLGQAAVAPLAYLALQTIEGHFVTPAVIGRRLKLNPFAVFLAIGFCAWLWGPIGAFVAVPLLITLTVTHDRVFPEDTPHLPE